VRSLGILSGRWEDNIKIDLREIGREIVDWVSQAHDRGHWRGNECSGSVRGVKFLDQINNLQLLDNASALYI
jgi:hypothetical protein